MKAVQNLVSAAIALCALSVANAAAISVSRPPIQVVFTPLRSDLLRFQDSSVVPSASISGSATPSGVASDSASDSGLSTSPTSTSDTVTDFPTSTGGYVVTGVYTTCLTLTFAAPTPGPTNPAGPIIVRRPTNTSPLPSHV
jgi:hypothetical protein